MEKISLDFTNEEKVSVIKDKVRQTLIADFMEFLNERYERARQTKSNKVGVIVGYANDMEGFAQEVVGIVEVSCMPWYSKYDGLKRPVRKFELDAGTIFSDEDIEKGLDKETNGADEYAFDVEAKKNKSPKK